MTTIRVAAVQASYVLMDRDVAIDRVAVLTAAAAADGAQLVVFPEVFAARTCSASTWTPGPAPRSPETAGLAGASSTGTINEPCGGPR